MARIACTTWDGGGNLVVFRALAERLRGRGHDVELRVSFSDPPLLDGDVLLVDHMASLDGLQAVLATGKPAATVVHTMWSFVPRLEGTFAPAGYLDVLAGFERNLVYSIRQLDPVDAPPNVRWVGPVVEPEGPDAGWAPPSRSLVVVSMGSHDLGDVPVLQRILDAVEPLPVDVVVTARADLDPSVLRVPANVAISGYVRHAALLPHADLFVGHGGHGGIMAALTFGVPMVLLPLDRDQPHNAQKAAAAGAAQALDKEAPVDVVRTAIESVRTGTRERSRAIELANAIAAYGDAAVTEVEALLA